MGVTECEVRGDLPRLIRDDGHLEVARALGTHAQVIPSVLVQFVRRSVSYSHGHFRPADLAAWPFPTPLTDLERTQLAAVLLNRFRATGSDAWQSMPLEVEWTKNREDWLKRCFPREYLEALPRELDAWQRLSLMDFKRAWKKPTAFVLGLVAKLEAADWLDRQVATEAMSWLKEQPEPAFLTEDEARKAVEDACSLPWLAAVQSTDLRFKSVGPAGIRSALQSFADANEKQRQSLLKIAAIAIAADRQSLVQELEAMAWASLPYCVPGPQVGNESKWVAIFVARYSGARGASTLAEVGARFDLTRERIRQVCERFETALKEHPSAWPALDRVARIASRVAPCSLEEANSQIEPHLGPGMGMEVAVDLAEMLGQEAADSYWRRSDPGSRRLRGGAAG